MTPVDTEFGHQENRTGRVIFEDLAPESITHSVNSLEVTKIPDTLAELEALAAEIAYRAENDLDADPVPVGLLDIIERAKNSDDADAFVRLLPVSYEESERPRVFFFVPE